MKNILIYFTLIILLNLSFQRIINNEVRNLNPKQVWGFFVDISKIPHCSMKEKAIREFLKNYAQTNNHFFREDEYGNAVMRIKATPGKETKPTLVLQSHLDMVCEKNRESNHNFETDPLTLLFDETKKWVKANGTTLGADDGSGIAMSLALTIEKDLAHGPLELLFLVEEEIGLRGAQNLKPGNGFINGTVLINIDSGPEDLLTTGCAGGMTYEAQFAIEKIPYTNRYTKKEIHLGGLTGGHSGVDIHLGRANSLKLIGRLFAQWNRRNIDYHFANVKLGGLANAIPREGFVTVVINPNHVRLATEVNFQFLQEIKNEFQMTDKNIFLNFNEFTGDIKEIYTEAFTKRLVRFLMSNPHGVVRMSPEFPTMPETSLNFAQMEAQNGRVVVRWSIRSFIESAKNSVRDTLISLTELAGGSHQLVSNYVGWQPNLRSPLLGKSIEIYKRLYGKEPRVSAIHAGLEPGIVGSIYPNVKDNMISIGPNNIENHSPAERVEIASMEKSYNFLKELIKEYAK